MRTSNFQDIKTNMIEQFQKLPKLQKFLLMNTFIEISIDNYENLKENRKECEMYFSMWEEKMRSI